MPDSPQKTGKRDADRINIHQDHEIQYWSKKFGVTPDRLKQAARKAGPMVKDVKRELGA